MDALDAVVVGAGQAGLAASYYLCEQHRTHVVLERGRIGESWISQRWDSFRLNTPNFMNALPGLPYDGPEPDAFDAQAALVEYFQRYVKRFDLPVRTGVNVVSLQRSADGQSFVVDTTVDGKPQEPLLARAVIVACGVQCNPKLPALRTRLPARITQLHTAEYRNPESLPPGAVLVVGSGQSGCQIAEELLAAGRTVYLGTSKVVRVPRRYRGREILEWWVEMGFMDITYDSLEDKSISRLAQPLVSGVGRYGHTVSLQQLAGLGIVILGRLHDVQDDTLLFGDEAAAHIQFADGFAQRMKGMIDGYIAQKGLTAPHEDDPADAPDPEARCASPLRELNLRDADISTVIWATGFTGDFGWIHLPILDAEGRPLHRRGVSPVAGLYFVGFPWLNSRKSGILYGVGDDARYIADELARQLS
jgi:putative flavoprotein involved in K+ transport